MNAMALSLSGILTLKTEAFQAWRDAPQVFRRAFVLLVVVGLIIGVVSAAVTTVRSFRQPPELVIRQAMEEALRGIDQGFASGNAPPEFRRIFRESFRQGFEMGLRIAGLPTILPRPATILLRGLAILLSSALGLIGFLLVYSGLTQIFARSMGGQGTIQQQVGVGALSSIPQAITALTPLLDVIPLAGGCLTFLVGLLAIAWSIAIYVKATAVVHGLDTGRAAAAVVLPAITLGTLAVVLSCLVIAFIVAAMAVVA